MIKFALRRNLIYPFQLLLWGFFRDLEEYLIELFLNYDNSIIYTTLMFLGEIFAGLIFYLYHEKYLLKEKKSNLLETIDIGYREERKLKIDNNKKINFLIITAALFDFVQFLMRNEFGKYIDLLGSFELRIRGTFTLNTAFCYHYVLRLPILKHQVFSLALIGICVLIIIITEFIFQEFDIFNSHAQFILVLFLILATQFINSLQESIEKYLFEYNQLSSFYLLMYEGIVGFVLSCSYYAFKNPFKELIKYPSNHTTSEFIILIFAFILYIILSGLKNVFRLETIKLYSPMASTFMDYILNPFIIIYLFFHENDFIFNGKSNYTYFIINLLISIILSFCGCIYNEFLILFCCGFEYNTHNQIMIRSNTESDIGKLYDEDDENDDNVGDKKSETSDYEIPMGKIK